LHPKLTALAMRDMTPDVSAKIKDYSPPLQTSFQSFLSRSDAAVSRGYTLAFFGAPLNRSKYRCR
jgi:hypothetical protein